MSIIFYSIGDWGKLNQGLRATAKSMDLVSKVKQPSFILSLGDNFYPNGVTSSTDEQWETTYKQIFTGKNLFCPWYAVLGNHDYILNPQAQIDYYLEKRDIRWTMPYRYYHVTKTYDNTTIQLVCIDTVELDLISTTLLPRDVIKREGLTQSKSDTQLVWIEETLAASTADWLIVVGHYNMYTGGWHGSNRNLINLLKPLFIKYKVDMYISGHCHHLEHLSDSGIEYVISGSGAKTGDTNRIYQTKFEYGSNGYTIHEINEGIMKTSFIDSYTSQVLYSFEQEKKRNLD
jgi:tartrate-resistant acid phosphatase type 5